MCFVLSVTENVLLRQFYFTFDKLLHGVVVLHSQIDSEKPDVVTVEWKGLFFYWF